MRQLKCGRYDDEDLRIREGSDQARAAGAYQGDEGRHRTHGEENLPAGPAVYVVNHFTRMETFFLPYIIEKRPGWICSRSPISVSSPAVSALPREARGDFDARPERAGKMIGGLLRGDRSCMIFPEGQMVKDKSSSSAASS